MTRSPGGQEGTTLTDEVLLSRVARERDAAAIELLYDRHVQTVYSLLLRIVHSPELADELLQETFWQVWQKASTFRGSGAPAAWICRIARNKALDQLRRQKARPQPVASGQGMLEQMEAPAHTTVEVQANRNWDRENVRQALLQIPDDQRLCLELAYFDGMSQREIAEQTNTPVGTIKTRVRMGMSKLERLLRGIGYQEGDLA